MPDQLTIDRVQRLLALRGYPEPLTPQEVEMLADLIATAGPQPDAALADAVQTARAYDP